VDLTSGLWLVCEQGLAWVAAWEAELPGLGWPEAPAGADLVLDVPGSVGLGGGWRLGADRVEQNGLLEMATANRDSYQAWLDEAALTLPLMVRRRKLGDRITPLGMPDGSLKISDLMINQRLPRRARAAWPLVLSGAHIAWAPGLHSGHAFRLTQASRSAVHLQLIHEKADML
jgi:tRNA(Ile)-lysidine synthetase-like protein